MAQQTGQMHCGQCGSYDYTFAQGETDEQTIANLLAAQDEAQDAHRAWHAVTDTVHIRKQINPQRIVTGNQFYKDRCKLGPAENGSQPLCDGQNTTSDISWAQARTPRGRSYATCEDCKRIHAQAHN